MKKCYYAFSKRGIKAMYNDSLNMIFSALCGENPDFTIDELDIHITIGNLETTIPIDADSFDSLFGCLNEINELNSDFYGEDN